MTKRGFGSRRLDCCYIIKVREAHRERGGERKGEQRHEQDTIQNILIECELLSCPLYQTLLYNCIKSNDGPFIFYFFPSKRVRHEKMETV